MTSSSNNLVELFINSLLAGDSFSSLSREVEFFAIILTFEREILIR